MEESLVFTKETQKGICVYENKYARILEMNDTCLLVEAISSYIPIESFKETFNEVGRLVRSHSYTKLIFDKRNLKVFHQPSMVWYFTEWKEEMYDLGLSSHRKILPPDPVFAECVKLGREKLSRENPKAKYHQMDIAYSSSVEEALRS